MGSSNIESLTEVFEISIAPPSFLPVFIPALICGLITLIVYDVTKVVHNAKKRKKKIVHNAKKRKKK